VDARIVRPAIKFRTSTPPELAGAEDKSDSPETTRKSGMHSDFLDSWFPDSGQKNPDDGNFNDCIVTRFLT